MYAILYKPFLPADQLHLMPNWVLHATTTDLNNSNFRHKLRCLMRSGRVNKIKILGEVKVLPESIKEILNGMAKM
jgi:hypothetical protein